MKIDKIQISVPEYVARSPILASSETGKLEKEVKSISVPTSTQGSNAVMQLSSLKIAMKTTVAEKGSVSAHDVATFILQQCGEMTAMKLQKLIYYSQAWSLVWDEEPLFNEEIQAWANGPVVPALYVKHQGLFKVRKWNGKPENLNDAQRETVLKVIEFYGQMSSQVLSDLTHREDPWLKARSGLGIGERGNRVISLASMAEYYSSL
jgi:uncharacterized phage-associated protein